jgi:hypothetical protein
MLSILIVNWNTRAVTLDCLRSLRDAALALPHEVLLVDNASADGSAEAIAAAFPEVRLIRNAENKGFAAANNQALAEACGRYALLLNSDTLVAPGEIEKLVAFLEARPQAGVVGPKLLNPDGSFQLSALRFIEPWDVFYEYTRFPRLLLPRAQRAPRRLYHPDAGVPNAFAHEVDYVVGAALLIRRSVAEAIGPMDEGYFMYAEELDWCYRAKRAGHEVWFEPAAAITHLGGQSARRVPQRMLAHRFVSSFRFLRKHHGRGAERLVRLLLAWGAWQNRAIALARRLARKEAPEAFREQWADAGVVWRTALRGAVPAELA